MSQIRASAAALLMLVSCSGFAAGPIPLPVPTLPGLALGQVLGNLPGGGDALALPTLPGLDALIVGAVANGLSELEGLGALPGQSSVQLPGLALPGLTLQPRALPDLGLLPSLSPPKTPSFGPLPGRPGDN